MSLSQTIPTLSASPALSFDSGSKTFSASANFHSSNPVSTANQAVKSARKSARKSVESQQNTRQTSENYDSALSREDRSTTTLRRWESAQTTRLNSSQWCGVTGQPINYDLIADRPTLVARSRYERRNNPIVEGVVDSFAIDVVGESGPSLIVESDNEEYNRIFKEIWESVWSTIEVTGLHGIDLLTRLVGQEWDNGDWLNRIVFDSSRENEPVASRLLDIDPERLETDPKYFGKENITMGVERDTFGRPIFYHIKSIKDQFLSPFFPTLYKYDRIPADDIIHCFVSREPGQVRGFPSLASCLQEMADLRDYDYQTLDAARLAANSGGVMFTRDAQLVSEENERTSGSVPEQINFERQTIKKIPAGYEFAPMPSVNPNTQYIDFRHEKLRSLGRVKHMPLLMVLLSAEQSNFSQSRIDLNVIYERGLMAYRRWIERNWLNRLINMVRREAKLAYRPGGTARDSNPFMLPAEPMRVEYKFGWEPLGQANEKDAVLVKERNIALGLSTPEWEHAKAGTSEDAAIESLKRTNKKRKAAGLEPITLGMKPENEMKTPGSKATKEVEAENPVTESAD